MLRRNVETTKTAARFQIGALLLVLFGVLAILANSMLSGTHTLTAAKGPQLERGHHTPLDERWFR